jgi:flagellar basal body-associated protein FliL
MKKKGLAAVLTATVMAMAVWVFGASNAAHAKFTCSPASVVAQAFDTIWQIATDNCEGNLQNVVHHMIQLNDGSAILQIGQVVQIPAENS